MKLISADIAHQLRRKLFLVKGKAYSLKTEHPPTYKGLFGTQFPGLLSLPVFPDMKERVAREQIDLSFDALKSEIPF